MNTSPVRIVGLFFLCLAGVSLVGCATADKTWTPGEFEAYRLEKGKAHAFAFKTFDTEINNKLNIVSYNCLDTKNTIDILPVEGIRSFMEETYGVTIDTSEFTDLRARGKLVATIGKDDKGRDQIALSSRELAIDGASVGGLGGMGLIGLLAGTSWTAINWSEYREEVSAMEFRYKLERGKSDQMQVFVCLAPLGSYISVMLRVTEGEPDAKGYYKLRVVAERQVRVDFKSGKKDTEILSRTVAALPELLKLSDAR